MKILPSILLSFFTVLSGCNDGGDDGGAVAVSGECGTETALSEAAPATGQMVFTLEIDLDPCSVDGFVVGHPDDLKVEKTTGDSEYVINNIPPGPQDVIVTGALQIDVASLAESAPTHGARFDDLEFLGGVRKDQGSIEVPLAGSLSGTATLVGQSDHAGIDAYIPGTSYTAKTDENGAFSISSVPVGAHNLYFEKDGYHRGQMEDIDVATGQNTAVTAVELRLSTGAEGFIVVENGETTISSRSPKIVVGATEDAVLMKVSESNTFDNISWSPISSTTTYTFDSDGAKTLYVKFSDANGLESSPFSTTVTVDTTAPSLSSFLFGDCPNLNYLVVNSPSGLPYTSTYDDGLSGVKKVTLEVNGVTSDTATAATLSGSITEDSPQTICTFAEDNVGNVSTKTCQTSFVDPLLTNTYDTASFGTSNTYIRMHGSSSPPADYYLAQSFTPTENIAVNSVFTNNGFTYTLVEAQIRTDDSGDPSSTILGSGTYSGRSTDNTCDFLLLNFSLSSQVSLSQGVKYWLILKATSADAVAYLYSGSTNNGVLTSGHEAKKSNDGSSWSTACYNTGTTSYEAGCDARFGLF